MFAPGACKECVVPNDDELQVAEKISKLLGDCDAFRSWAFALLTGFLFSVAVNGMFAAMGKGFWNKFGPPAASILLASNIIGATLVFGAAIYFYFYRPRRKRSMAELKKLAGDQMAISAIRKIILLKRLVGPLERFDWILHQVEGPTRLGRKYLGGLPEQVKSTR